MKKLFIMTLATIVMVACSKSDGGGNGETITKEQVIEAISAKWNIASSPTYVSIELNKSGNYIVVKNASAKATANDYDVVFGTYSVKDSKTIDMVNFGTLIINSISSSQASFSLTPKGEQSVTLSANKSKEEIPASTKTDLLCRTWDVVTYTSYDESEDRERPIKVYFSSAGTYLVYFESGVSGLSNWKWYDNNQVKIYYSWKFPPVWSDDNVVTITELTSTKLIVTEITNGKSEVFELKPSAINKAQYQTITKQASGQKGGFFGIE